MLDNEPEGGDRTGTEPDSAATEQNETTPVRRTRSSRRRASTVSAEPAQAVSDQEQEAEASAPVATDAEPVQKASRRRRKATTSAAADSAGSAGATDGTDADGVVTGDGQQPPVKATRSRRRKVTMPANAGEAAAVGEVTSGTPAAVGEAVVTDAPGSSGEAGTAEPSAIAEPGVAEEAAAARSAGADEPAGDRLEPAVTDQPAVTDPDTAADEVAAGDAAVAARARATDESVAADQAPAVAAAATAGGGEPAVTGETAATGAPAVAPLRPASLAPGHAADVPGGSVEEQSPRRRAALTAPAVLFMAPQPEAVSRPIGAGEAGPVDRGFRVAGSADSVGQDAVESAAATETGTGEIEPVRRRRRSRRSAEPTETTEPVEFAAEGDTVDVEPMEGTAEAGAAEPETGGEEGLESTGRRRRRRGRRGRGRGKGTTEDEVVVETEEEVRSAAEEEAEATEPAAEGAEGEGVTRRRRRRRRKGSAAEAEAPAEDGIPTVVKIREPRRSTDEVQGVSGSTRLEAKRQRRRDGREQRRTRPPILTESEFLARREAVDRVMVIRQRGDRTQIAVLEDGVLVEHYVSRASSSSMAGNVYLGKVQNVLPSMEAAFVDVGRGRNAVLYAGEVNWDSTGLEGRARSIEQALRSGDSVLVQVTKDPIGHKGARLTSHIALSGRHLVYVPNGNASGISRKLPDTERKRLRDILKKLVPDGAGVIVRTAAEGATEDELARDVKRLQAQWEDIQAKAASGGAPALLYKEPDLVIRVVRDLFNEDFRELVVQGEEAYDMVESYLSHVSPDLVPRLRRHTGTADVFAEWRIDEQILKALDRKVFLPSGGHLVIDRTEAMTVIDVNTGKYTGAGGNLEETVTRNNLEAAEEIVRQLRLRDIGGIVVIDFIDMVLESNRELVLRRLTECLGRDRTKHQVTEITSLGLVQMTRKRIGAGLLEAFSETCECCKGRGVIIHTEPVPEKSRSQAVGDKVKAVAAAATPAASAPASTGADGTAVAGRRRARRSAAERVVVEVSAEDTAGGTNGYDLSRPEPAPEPSQAPESPEPSQAPESPEPENPVEDRQAGSMRLASADDPDAIEEITDGDGGDGLDGVNGRRRARRGSTRRRTRS